MARNADGSGVLVGLTTISNVHGYNKTAEGVVPDEGRLTYRGYDAAELISAAQREGRFGYEEVSYLLLTGQLPTQAQLDDFRARIGSRRQLPEGYLRIFPRTTFSPSIMNVLQRATLLLYAFDNNPDDTSPVHEVDVALSMLGRWPRVASVAHQAFMAAQTFRGSFLLRVMASARKRTAVVLPAPGLADSTRPFTGMVTTGSPRIMRSSTRSACSSIQS